MKAKEVEIRYNSVEMERGLFVFKRRDTGHIAGYIASAGYLKRNNLLDEETRDMPHGNKRYLPILAREMYEARKGMRKFYVKGGPYQREYRTFINACFALQGDIERANDVHYYVKGD